MKSDQDSKRNRIFSEEFKRSKVKELELKQITMAKLVTLYGVSRTAIYKWMEKYSVHHHKATKVVIQMESESAKTSRLQEKVADLERVVGQKQIEIDFLNKLIEIGSEELGIDIKKKFITKHLNGSEEIKRAIPGQ
jgi:transposase-like protein